MLGRSLPSSSTDAFVPEIEEIRFFRVFIDRSLTYGPHLDAVAARGRQRLGFFLFLFYARQRSGLRSNTKIRNAAVHYRLHAVGAEKRHGVTDTYRALP